MITKIGIKIDWDGHNYAACADNDDIACIVTGRTIESVKADMLDALTQHIEWMKEDDDPLLEEFCGKWEPEWYLTTRAQLKYSDAFITRKALSDVTGISIQQLSHYANGWRTPRPEMQRRITAGIRAIQNKLSIIS